MNGALNGLRTALLLLPLAVVADSAALALGWARSDHRYLPAAILSGFAFVVFLAGGLGLVGLLDWPALAILTAASALVTRRFSNARRRNSPALPTELEDRPFPPFWDRAGVLIAAVVMAGAAALVTDRPVLEYDALTYHLHLPAQWLNAGRIFLIDTPFGDAAPAYAPANASLWFAWLMAPWRYPSGAGFRFAGIDAVVKYAGLPFAALLAASLNMIAHRLEPDGNPHRPAWIALLLPWVIWQSVQPAADLVMSACLLAGLAFAADYARRPSAPAALLSGAALGLALGTKYLALLDAPVVALGVLVLTGCRVKARDAAIFAAVLIAFGAPWYLRNWALTGNPLFPSQITIGGHVLFDGAYTREAMLASVFHVPSLGAAAVVASHALGHVFTPLALLALLIGLWRLFADRRSGAFYLVAPIAFVWHFAVVPYNSQDRFLIWAAALALLPLAVRPSSTVGRTGLALAIVATVAAALFTPAFTDRAFDAPVIIRPLINPGGLWLFALALLLAAVPLAVPAVRGGSARAAVAASFLAAFVGLFAVSGRHGAGFTRVPMDANPHLLTAWSTLWRGQPSVVAYAGANRPFHLAGRTGRSRVISVPPDGRVDATLVDRIREDRATGRLNLNQEKDAWSRRVEDPDAWLGALRREGVSALFLETLSVEERRYLRYDEDGFPVERAWARERPDVFVLDYAADDVELYRLRPGT